MKPHLLSVVFLAMAITTLGLNGGEPAGDKSKDVKHPAEPEPQAALLASCQKMLEMQTAVRDGTDTLHKRSKAVAGNKPPAKDRQAARKLAEREEKIVGEVNKALDALKRLKPAVAFPEVFAILRKDMMEVQRRLENGAVGADTLLVEQDIIDTLKEMITALQKT